ncbi:CD209 antigen-like protein E isoform X2 [Hoplias malabaricus]|uniref:CD209 antigen-like protein E isoform X2 n=1 Tax=Hoplias malabaricus TaxID=27720 RepID=UPI003461997D
MENIYQNTNFQLSKNPRNEECPSSSDWNKRVAFEALSEDYSRAQEQLSVQQNSLNGNRTCSLCEERWMFFGFKCYYFSTDKLNWTMSRDYCTGKGGHLVTVTSKEEQDFVSSHAQVTRWIGLNDLETEGQWMWVNNKSLSETGVKFWFKRESDSDGEPDNWKEMDFSGENCGALGHESGYIDKWFDDSCQNLKEYICEK